MSQNRQLVESGRGAVHAGRWHVQMNEGGEEKIMQSPSKLQQLRGPEEDACAGAACAVSPCGGVASSQVTLLQGHRAICERSAPPPPHPHAHVKTHAQKRLALKWSRSESTSSAPAERNCAYLSESLLNAIAPDISIPPYLHLFISPSLHLFISPSLHLSISPSLLISPSLHLSISPSLHLS